MVASFQINDLLVAGAEPTVESLRVVDCRQCIFFAVQNQHWTLQLGRLFAHLLDDVRGAVERLIEKLMTRLVSFKMLQLSVRNYRERTEKRARLLAAPRPPVA